MQGPVQTGETSPSSEKEEKPSFLLSWPPGFLFAMRRPLPGAWGHSRRSGRPRRPRGLLRLRAPVPAPGQRPAWPPGGRSGRRGRCLRAPPPGTERELDRPACGSRRVIGVPSTTQVSDGVTGHRRPQRPRGDSGRSSRARGPDAAPRAAPRGQRQSGLRRAMLAVSRPHAANPDEPEPRFPCLHAAATLGPRGSRGAVVAQRCLPGLLAE